MLTVRNILKQYANHVALDHVSMEVEKGSIFGLLGPNGAGKTSLIRIINQITAPDEGEVFLNGERLRPEHIPLIGYLPEERGLYKKMEVGEHVLYLARLKGLNRSQAAERVKYWFQKMGIESWWKKKVEELSKGMQQKVQFIATVLHEPQLLILDEPFTGFDPVNADLIKQEILNLNKKGTTIIFSTHRMESVEEMCDSIVLINKAKKILEGKLSAIKSQYRSNTYQVRYEGALGEALSFQPGKFSLLSQEENPTGGGNLKVRLLDGTSSNELLGTLIPLVHVQEMREVVPGIHDIFVKSVKEA
ncbi:ABC-2 type transport system ATP-binding protein [Anseongella ginsenosidimutans]|uniref:ABC-2 type transport system ATP-binding protein n=1 Tax=Anseongella ginsenosidimutans TaxID=496056 RepID=A0A4R3KPI4_9SPHI|nr:ATP-binding cassette domain-containing protein [Anseongella ginsenosidimutans]QEC53952.1 ABC transporter ATP-binding protein [Anseongella ginsenosidimutans]TCS86339.1 ABC-2 type transport system ATP-binding protein [Anseongella ginsenosidimutans]